MPHIELKYSDDLMINTSEIFDAIENTINDYDASAGVCKSRAYPTNLYKHTHALISIALLKKEHRDAEFSHGLAKRLEKAVKALIQQNCYFSLSLEYSSDYYITGYHSVEK